jgi:hypothetical protein
VSFSVCVWQNENRCFICLAQHIWHNISLLDSLRKQLVPAAAKSESAVELRPP